MNRQDVKKIAGYWNNRFKTKQIDIYDYDKTKIDTHRTVLFFAKILSEDVLIIPKYIHVLRLSVKDEEITFSISVSNIIDILFLDKKVFSDE